MTRTSVDRSEYNRKRRERRLEIKAGAKLTRGEQKISDDNKERSRLFHLNKKQEERKRKIASKKARKNEEATEFDDLPCRLDQQKDTENCNQSTIQSCVSLSVQDQDGFIFSSSSDDDISVGTTKSCRIPKCGSMSNIEEIDRFILDSTVIGDIIGRDRNPTRIKAPLTLLTPRTIHKRTIEITESPPIHDKRPFVILYVYDEAETEEGNLMEIRSHNNQNDPLEEKFRIPSEFNTTTDNMLVAVGQVTKTSPQAADVGFRMRLMFDKVDGEHIALLHQAISGHDIHELLTPNCFITDSSINYYRCLLMKEEFKRCHMNETSRNRCFIHSTLFMTVLTEGGEGRKGLGYNFNGAKRIDRKLIGE